MSQVSGLLCHVLGSIATRSLDVVHFLAIEETRGAELTLSYIKDELESAKRLTGKPLEEVEEHYQKALNRIREKRTADAVMSLSLMVWQLQKSLCIKA